MQWGLHISQRLPLMWDRMLHTHPKRIICLLSSVHFNLYLSLNRKRDKIQKRSKQINGFWGFRSSGMWHHVPWRVIPGVSKERIAFILMGQVDREFLKWKSGAAPVFTEVLWHEGVWPHPQPLYPHEKNELDRWLGALHNRSRQSDRRVDRAAVAKPMSQSLNWQSIPRLSNHENSTLGTIITFWRPLVLYSLQFLPFPDDNKC